MKRMLSFCRRGNAFSTLSSLPFPFDSEDSTFLWVSASPYACLRLSEQSHGVDPVDGRRAGLCADYLALSSSLYEEHYYKGNAETTRVMFHTIEEELTATRGRPFLTLADIENNVDLLKRSRRGFPRMKDLLQRSPSGPPEGHSPPHHRDFFHLTMS